MIMKVMVYYNLNKRTFSVKHNEKVIMHSDYVKLGDVEFRVRSGGRDKVRSEKVKNVHAFVIGTLLDYHEYPFDSLPVTNLHRIVTYDPYKFNSFVYKDNEEPVYKANEVDMINLKDKIFVLN